MKSAVPAPAGRSVMLSPDQALFIIAGAYGLIAVVAVVTIIRIVRTYRKVNK